MTNIINGAIQYLSTKSCSELELRDYLLNQFSELCDSEKAVGSALQYLNRNGFINDERLAHQLALHYAHKGNRFIQQILIQRKIGDKVISNVLNTLPTELTRAAEEARQRINGLQAKGEELKATLIRFLSGRQFSLTTINTVIEKLTISRSYQLKVLL